MEASVEKNLQKEGLLELYNTKVQGYIDRGVFWELEDKEMEDWVGPVNYITHHGVRKLQSTTTALRVISNSSLKNNQAGGLSYNDILPMGPNSLNPLLQVLVAWRAYIEVVTRDYAKAYNTIETFPEELHMRRLVWRCGGER